MFVYYKCYILIDSTSLKKLMSIKQVHQKSVTFVTIAVSYIVDLSFNKMSAIDVMVS